MENYGLALKVLRLHFKYTQREIADKVGVSNHAVSKWENGINQPDISTLRLICDIYGVTTEQFFRIASGESVEEVLSQPQEETPALPDLQEDTATQAPPAQAPIQGAGTHSTGKTSFAKRWWVWLVCGVLVVSVIGIIALALGGKGDGAEQSSQGHSQSDSAPFDSDENTPIEKGYTVQFAKQDGSVLWTEQHAFGEAWTISDSIVTGYTFDFWLCNGEKYDGGDTFCVTEGEEYLFVAHYTPNQFRICYKLPVHNYFYEEVAVYLYDGNNYLRAGLFAGEGGEYFVDGWIIDGVEYEANAFIGNFSSENGAVFEAAPIWKKGEVEYVKLTFTCGYAENLSYTFSARIGEKVTMPVCEWNREGYTFKGWKNEKTGEVYLAGELFTLPSDGGEYAFTALWEALPDETN